MADFNKYFKSKPINKILSKTSMENNGNRQVKHIRRDNLYYTTKKIVDI